MRYGGSAVPYPEPQITCRDTMNGNCTLLRNDLFYVASSARHHYQRLLTSRNMTIHIITTLLHYHYWESGGSIPPGTEIWSSTTFSPRLGPSTSRFLALSLQTSCGRAQVDIQCETSNPTSWLSRLSDLSCLFRAPLARSLGSLTDLLGG